MGFGLATRTPFKVDVVRDRGALARIANGGNIENVYRLQIMNATESTQRFHISVEGLPDLKVVSEDDVTVESTQSRWVAVRLQAPYESAKPGSHTIHFEVQAHDVHAKASEKSVFIVPQ
jgi:polyferredoxin